MIRQRGEVATAILGMGFLVFWGVYIVVALTATGVQKVHQWNVENSKPEAQECAETDMDCHSKKAHEDLERYKEDNPL